MGKDIRQILFPLGVSTGRFYKGEAKPLYISSFFVLSTKLKKIVLFGRFILDILCLRRPLQTLIWFFISVSSKSDLLKRLIDCDGVSSSNYALTYLKPVFLESWQTFFCCFTILNLVYCFSSHRNDKRFKK